MTTETYKTRGGANQLRPVMSEAEYRSADMAGFCLACGQEADCCEPDARKYPCEACGQPKVYGLEELLMMDLLKFT
jgi:hypothetical protein